jgi:ATP synthase protein I
MSDEPEENPKWRRAAELSSLGLALPSSIAVGLFFGYWLDKWLNTHPWMLLLFLLLGIVSGFVSLFRGLRRLERKP